MTACPFCSPESSRVFHTEHPGIWCLWDRFPVSPGHALVLTRRHIEGWFDATREEQIGLLEGIEVARREILRYHTPAGFNIGVNVGASAGQTVPHLHVHVIPRFAGDVEDPRGGVRHVIPHLANYLVSEVRDEGRDHYAVDRTRVLGADGAPLFPALTRDIANAQRLDLAVAFILERGLERLRPHLQDLVDRGGHLRVLTGDYLEATEPTALALLLDLQQSGREPANVQLKVFVTGDGFTFHPKAYLLSGDRNGHIAYIGSSNVSSTALFSSVEWNYRFAADREPHAWRTLEAEFEALFAHPRTTVLTPQWVIGYARRRRAPGTRAEPIPVDPDRDAPPPPAPHSIQVAALESLAKTRLEGHHAGLVVLATGLGKTWLSAFDSRGYSRILFVAHREEILRQSRDTFAASGQRPASGTLRVM